MEPRGRGAEDDSGLEIEMYGSTIIIARMKKNASINQMATSPLRNRHCRG